MTRRGGFSPRVDVFYAKDPPRAAVIQAELAGIDLSRPGAPDRRPCPHALRPAQAAESPRAPSTSSSRSSTGRSTARSSSASRSTPTPRAPATDDGILRVELPLRPAREPESHACRSRRAARTRAARDRACSATRRRRVDVGAARARRRAGPAAARDGPLPGHAHAAGDRPGALGPAGQRRPRRRPHARDGRLAPARARDARPRGPLRRRRRRRRRAHAASVPDGTLRMLVQGGQRVRIERWTQDEPYLVGRDRGDARPRRAESPELDRAHAQRAGDVHRDRRAGPVPARGAADRGRQRRRSRARSATSSPASLRIPTEEKQALLEERRRRRAAAPAVARRSRASSRSSRSAPASSRRSSPRWTEPARVRPAPAAQGDPGGARRVRRDAGRGQRAARAARRDRAARGRPQAGRPRARPPREAAAAGRRARRHPHLPRVDRRRCRGTRRPRTTSISRTRARCSTPTTTTSSRSRTASSSSSRCAS